MTPDVRSLPVLVAGAGPAGLTAAWFLAKAGCRVIVVEARDNVGGQCGAVQVGDHRVDLGPHIFHPADEELEELWLEAAGERVVELPLKVSMISGGKTFAYPPRAGEVFTRLGAVEAIHCGVSFLASLRQRGRPAVSVRDWGRQRLGPRLSRMWVERYAEKLNGLPADQLDAAWAAEWLGDVNFLQVLREFVQGSSHTRHLPNESFRYPTDGASEVYVRLAEMVRNHGGEIRLSSPLQEIRTADGRVASVVAGGERIDCAALVATVPVQVLYRCLETGPPPEVGAALTQLRFRSALLVYVEVETSAASEEAFIYVHDEDVPFSRVTNYAAFQRSPNRKTTVLCVEHWVDPEALPESSDDQVVHRAIRDLQRCGIVEPGTAVLTSRVVRLSSALPIYRLGNRERVRQAADWLRGWQGMELAGRAASFRNLGQSQAMAEGAESARRLLRAAGLAEH